jgi:UDP-N-acetylglucosamine 2-epimerase (non-hydrolysing)
MSLWVVAGTRPEIIKLAPVILADKDCEVVLTGQHQAAREIAEGFGIDPFFDLNVDSSFLNGMVAEVMKGLDIVVDEMEGYPDCLVVQGDTTSAMAAALWAANNEIPVAHVEAGLRTYHREPFPEEINRRIISACTTYHFAPTERAAGNLMREGFQNVIMVGNTSIDTLKKTTENAINFDVPTALLTLHRRESWGKPLGETLRGILEWLDETDMQVLWPMHPNLAVQSAALSIDHPRLIKDAPWSYFEFIRAMRGSKFVITDSGGVQEEAAALGHYTVVVRKHTERQEAVEAGIARLVAPEQMAVYIALKEAESSYHYAQPTDVFGTGDAGERIVRYLATHLMA